MVNRIAWCAVAAVLFLSSPVHAEFAKKGTLSGSPRAEDNGPSKWSVYTGPSNLKSSVGLGVGAGYTLDEKWALEVGAVVPHPVHNFAHDSSVTTDSASTNYGSARVKSYGEIHLVGLYKAVQGDRFGVEAGGGVSLGLITNQTLFTRVPGSGTATIKDTNSHRLIPAPRVQVTTHYSLLSSLAVRLSLAYVYYNNTDEVDTHSYGLSFGGVVIEPGVEWRF